MNPRRPHSESLVFFELAGSAQKRIIIIKDTLVSRCTVHLFDNPQDTAGYRPAVVHFDMLGNAIREKNHIPNHGNESENHRQTIS